LHGKGRKGGQGGAGAGGQSKGKKFSPAKKKTGCRGPDRGARGG